MKRILIATAMILVAGSALAGGKKDGKTIRGKVSDNEGEPLAFANVLALSVIDSTFIAGTTTDTLGVFTLEAPTEGTLLLVSLLGYEDVYVTAGTSEISLNPSSLWLDGAGVTANLDFTYEGKGNAENVLFLKSNYILGVGVSKSFLNDALTIELKGNDLLKQKWEAVELYTTNFQLDQLARFHTRAVSLTLRYKFNSSHSRYRSTGAGTSEIDRLQ